MKLSDVYSTTEAAEIWGIDKSTVRRAIMQGRLIEGDDCRKSGPWVWLVTNQAMERVFGEKPNLKGVVNMVKTLTLTLDQYEVRGGTYDDSGNGGEVMNKDDFSFAVEVVESEGFDELKVLKEAYPDVEFWADSVTQLYLAWK